MIHIDVYIMEKTLFFLSKFTLQNIEFIELRGISIKFQEMGSQKHNNFLPKIHYKVYFRNV